MLHSVQKYLQGILNGLQTPLTEPLVCVIADPVIADAAQAPYAYLWGGRGELARRTAPRGPAWQTWKWWTMCSVVCVMSIDDPNVDDAFPLVIDQINGVLSATKPMPAVVTDAVTGYQSQILSLGEKATLDYARLRTTGATGGELVKFAADLELYLEEDVAFPMGSFYAQQAQSDGG